jgi:hypothetical protein
MLVENCFTRTSSSSANSHRTLDAVMLVAASAKPGTPLYNMLSEIAINTQPAYDEAIRAAAAHKDAIASKFGFITASLLESSLFRLLRVGSLGGDGSAPGHLYQAYAPAHDCMALVSALDGFPVATVQVRPPVLPCLHKLTGCGVQVCCRATTTASPVSCMQVRPRPGAAPGAFSVLRSHAAAAAAAATAAHGFAAPAAAPPLLSFEALFSVGGADVELVLTNLLHDAPLRMELLSAAGGEPINAGSTVVPPGRSVCIDRFAASQRSIRVSEALERRRVRGPDGRDVDADVPVQVGAKERACRPSLRRHVACFPPAACSCERSWHGLLIHASAATSRCECQRRRPSLGSLGRSGQCSMSC